MSAAVVRCLALVVALAGPLLGALTDINSGHFAVLPGKEIVAFYGVIALAVLGPFVFARQAGRTATLLRVDALIITLLGVYWLLFAGGMVIWVAPLLLIAAELHASANWSAGAGFLLSAAVAAVGVAGIYGFLHAGSASAWLGGTVLWLMPLPYLVARRRRLRRQRASSRR